jgi:DMSO reductase anchor subunit
MKNIEVLPATPQRAWGWPAAANFILGGTGAGFYLFSYLVIVLEDRHLSLSRHIAFGLLAPILVIIGILALAIMEGRPSRAIYLFHNLRQAWLSRETFFLGVFIPAAILDWLIPNPIIRVISVAAALALMVSQGAILYQIRAITGWNVLFIPVLFISSGLASGGGVVLLIGGLTRSPLPLSTIIMAMAAISINLAIWLLYLYWFRGAAFREAIEKLRRPYSLMITIGFGHILPLVLLFSLAGLGYSVAESPFPAETVSGLAILLGVISQKKAIVLRASNMKAIIIGASTN